MFNYKKLFILLVFLVSCKQADYLYPVVATEHSVPVAKETFVAEQKTFRDKLDVLWVIDNSPSMEDEQLRVINNTSRFIRQFTANTQMKWKMGLLSTDDSQNPFTGFTPDTRLDYEQPDAVVKFQSAVARLGITGSSDERAFDPIMLALKKYPDFNRRNSLLGIIIVSDEPEQSFRYKLPDFLNELKKLKGSLDDVLVYAVLGGQEYCGPFPKPPGFCSLCYEGSVYEAFVRATKGKHYKICEDFSDKLEEIGADLSSHIKMLKVSLKKRPDVNTIKVIYEDKEVLGGSAEHGGSWFYNRELNSIDFHDTTFMNSESQTIDVLYQERFLK